MSRFCDSDMSLQKQQNPEKGYVQKSLLKDHLL